MPLPLPFELIPSFNPHEEQYVWFLGDPHGEAQGPRQFKGEELDLLVAWVKAVNNGE